MVDIHIFGGKNDASRGCVRSTAEFLEAWKIDLSSIESILKAKGSEVATVTPDSNLKDATAELVRRGIAALIVTSGDKIVGLVLEREIVKGYAQHRDRLSNVSVKDVMRTEVLAVASEDSVTQAMALVTLHPSDEAPSGRQRASARWRDSIGDAVL